VETASAGPSQPARKREGGRLPGKRGRREFGKSLADADGYSDGSDRTGDRTGGHSRSVPQQLWCPPPGVLKSLVVQSLQSTLLRHRRSFFPCHFSVSCAAPVRARKPLEPPEPPLPPLQPLVPSTGSSLIFHSFSNFQPEEEGAVRTFSTRRASV
jgi:hypothetical protein